MREREAGERGACRAGHTGKLALRDRVFLSLFARTHRVKKRPSRLFEGKQKRNTERRAVMPPSVRQALLPLALSMLAAVAVVLHVSIYHRSESELYQIGDQEFLSMNSGVGHCSVPCASVPCFWAGGSQAILRTTFWRLTARI